MSNNKAATRQQTVAVVGATGVVGREAVSILSERRFPVKELRLLASARSAGEKLEAFDDEHAVQELKEDSFEGVDLVFFAAGSSVTKKFAPLAQTAGAISIDKSSLFRMDPDVPLVIPEVNRDALFPIPERKLIATPNCSTIQMVQVLAPLHQHWGLDRVVVSTYQAVSGAGKAGVEELENQVRDLFNFKDPRSTEVFGQRIAFNALPCIPGKEAFGEDGYTSEERKMMDETRKILSLPELRIAATCVRVPVFNSHSEAIHVSFKKPVSPDEVREVLAAEPNLLIVDEPSQHLYPSPQDAAGQDHTLVGRIRKDPSVDNGIALWCVSDNLRTGAALNAVRIAEALVAHQAEQEVAA